MNFVDVSQYTMPKIFLEDKKELTFEKLKKVEQKTRDSVSTARRQTFEEGL